MILGLHNRMILSGTPCRLSVSVCVCVCVNSTVWKGHLLRLVDPLFHPCELSE